MKKRLFSVVAVVTLVTATLSCWVTVTAKARSAHYQRFERSLFRGMSIDQAMDVARKLKFKVQMDPDRGSLVIFDSYRPEWFVFHDYYLFFNDDKLTRVEGEWNFIIDDGPLLVNLR